MEYIAAVVLVTLLVAFKGHDHDNVDVESEAWWCFICGKIESKVIESDDPNQPKQE